MSVRPQHTTVDGRTVSYREAGHGPVAIVTPGLGLTGRFYEHSFAVCAAAGIRLIVPDLPGWGATPGPRSGSGPGQNADFMLGFAAAIGVRRAVWIGHSLGAQVAVRVAVRRPDRAAGIVLAGPTGAPGRTELLRQARGLAVETWRTSFSVIRAVARDYIRTSPTRYFGTWLRYSGDDLLALLPAVQCPALVLAGQRDPVCTPDFIELLRHRMPKARVEWIRGATHALPRGQVDAFNRAVIDFVHSL